MATTTTLNPEAPLHVNALRILGVSATRSSFLNSVTSGLFKAGNTSEVLKNVQQVASKLDNLDIFDEIKVYLNTNPTVSDTVDVMIDLKEKPKGLYKTSIAVGDYEAYTAGSVAVRNIFGGAESANLSFSFGQRTKAKVEASISTPLNASPYSKLEAFVSGSIKDYSFINLYDENEKSAGIRFKGISSYGSHQVTIGMSDRDITAHPKASGTVRAHSSKNQKTFVSHSFVRDTRDSLSLPTTGHYVGMFQEVAGTGTQGEVHYVKQEMSAQYHKSLVGNELQPRENGRLILSTGLKAGLLATVDNDYSVNVSDRFYLGGPLSVRGFKAGGIGPRDGNDALGGNLFWAAGLSLVSSLPGLSHLPVKGHAFVNAGSIIEWNKNVPLADTVQELVKEPRTAAGFGLIFHHDVARVEVNFCVPLKFTSTDLPVPGLQFGLGVNFL
ncbi:surface antigen-domain-containing protein [Phycomyces blakesleeanus]|uniref:Bacterial surface antigen (D15) domain-containing protein n=2 Tax=Phycomyces blakesleeanus TaxID=4837 RepID=A0A162X766_PHYB8|nr:hypothetical protein PHYBLDRAFT_187225 [Phycomyces blakesleeanus NRRL 1555(-)]OAD72895.1 hypothetical protein PHYBLDRAFT_187225 [Phycomyces blakesleeanus NRRL 1555(-)]|eukprot:XP_018290935.1 hypothetical protein PHYBLDRAFT_187225 [Phycomyces blakesleeanus NRRL 1555(-)]